MPLRATDPLAGWTDERFKASIYGPPNSGKSWAACGFPGTYYVDGEKSAQFKKYRQRIKDGGGDYLQENRFDELEKEVRSLLTEKHEYRTLVIDPITTFYDDLLEQGERIVGNKRGRHYGYAKIKWKRFANLLLRLDMNVIVIAHGKVEYDDDMNKVGNTFDGPKSMDHVFDIVLEAAVSEERGFHAFVRKSRAEGFPMHGVIQFSFEELAKRFGFESLRRAMVRDAVEADTLAELESRLQGHAEAKKLRSGLLVRHGVQKLHEIPQEGAVAAIKWLRSQQGELDTEPQAPAEDWPGEAIRAAEARAADLGIEKDIILRRTEDEFGANLRDIEKRLKCLEFIAEYTPMHVQDALPEDTFGPPQAGTINGATGEVHETPSTPVPEEVRPVEIEMSIEGRGKYGGVRDAD